jgi:hypothetical protein
MKISTFVAGLVLAGLAAPALAQSVPDDVRCLMLSNVFAKKAKEARGREAAAQALLFYVGRLDGRADPHAITAAMRAQGRIDEHTASTEMGACAKRVFQAEQTIQALGRAAAPAK